MRLDIVDVPGLIRLHPRRLLDNAFEVTLQTFLETSSHLISGEPL
jgi:hypothetical protein